MNKCRTLALASAAAFAAFQVLAAGGVQVFVQSVSWETDYAVEGIERAAGTVVGFSDDGRVVEFGGTLVRTKDTRTITMEPNFGYVLKAGNWHPRGQKAITTMGICKISGVVPKADARAPAQTRVSSEWQIAGERLAIAKTLHRGGAEFTATLDKGLEVMIRSYLDKCK